MHIVIRHSSSRLSLVLAARLQASLPPGPVQYGQSEFEFQEPELPAARQARIQAEIKEAAAAAVDELDPQELQSLAPAPPPDRQLMVYDDI